MCSGLEVIVKTLSLVLNESGVRRQEPFTEEKAH